MKSIMGNQLMGRNKQRGLCREEIGESSARRVGLTLLIAALMVLALNFMSSKLLDVFSPNSGYQLIRAKWDLLAGIDAPVDIVILGDSGANQAVDTELISQVTGLTAVNLATIGNSLLLNDYWQLRAYLEAFGSPPGASSMYMFTMSGIAPSILA